MKIKIIFLCVLSLITLVLSQFEFAYSVDLGTEVAGVLSTDSNYSNSSVMTVHNTALIIIGFGVIFAIIIGITELDKKSDEGDKKKYGKSKPKSCFGCSMQFLFVMIILSFFASMLVPNFRKCGRGTQDRKKVCYSNMRVINSAVEMYNMGVTGSNMMNELNLSKLVENRYLRAAPNCPETGRSEEYSGSNLTTTGQIHCAYKNVNFPEKTHGYLDLEDK